MSGDLDAVPNPPRPERGPWDLVPATPALAAGSVRRSSSIDMRRPGGFDGPITAEIRGRDVARDVDGRAVVLDEVRLTAVIEEWSGRLLTIDGHDHPGVEALLGTSVRRGFGRALAAALADELAERTLLASILEDLNGALLVSGYAPLRAGLLGMSPADGAAQAEAQQDICAGWARGAPLTEMLRATGSNAVPFGPIAPRLTDGDGWHETSPALVESVTRIRSLDVGPATDGHGGAHVRAHFRDAYESEEGPMTMHEYVVLVHVAGADPTIDRLVVEPHVLPWRECPAAAASGAQLIGTRIADIAPRVRAELVGTSTCTHLNSTLRSLADVDRLLGSRR